MNWTCGTKCMQGVKPTQVCQGQTTKAYVAYWQDHCLVSFMGTQNANAVLQDIRIDTGKVKWSFCANCSVHAGFLAEYESLSGCIMAALPQAGCGKGSEIRATGHSLGGALVALALLHLKANGWTTIEAYTFGMPRTGDALFATAFRKHFQHVTYRVTHHMDPVVHLPPTSIYYEHVEPEVFYEDSMYAGHQRCDTDDDETCS